MPARISALPIAEPALVLATPCCRIGAFLDDQGGIREIRFLPPEHALIPPRGETAQRIENALQAYLRDPRSPIDPLPFTVRGSAFQQRVWRTIDAIPCGLTRRYGELAEELGSHPRAVGQACGANPFPIFTPCHRVIGRGDSGGFAHAREGWLLATKRWLLMHEGAL